MRTLIRHAASKPPATIRTLPIAMIQTAFGALLMTPIGGSMLQASRFNAARCAAVPLPAIAAYADPEHRPAIRVVAKPLPENNFSVNRHPRLQAAFDNGCGSCQGKNYSEVGLRFGMKATYKEPRCSIQRGSCETAFSQKHLTTPGPPDDERPMIAPAARMISSCPIPADVQKTTFSDD